MMKTKVQSALAQIRARAVRDERITALGLEGSVMDPTRLPDDWQDLDVTLFTTDVAGVTADWQPETFGNPTIGCFFRNENLFGTSSQPWPTWLIRFADGLRVDLKVAPAEDVAAYLAADSLNTVDWSRSGRLVRRKTSDASHRVLRPSATDFYECYREFYWQAANVVKALSRGQLIGANTQMETVLRPELWRMLTWRAAIGAQGSFNPGAYAQNLEEQLDPQERLWLRQSYRQSSLWETMVALRTLVDWFELVSSAIAQLAGWPVAEYDLAREQLAEWLATLTEQLKS